MFGAEGNADRRERQCRNVHGGAGYCIDDSGDMTYFDRMIEDPMCTYTIDAIFSSGGQTMPYAYGTFPGVINRCMEKVCEYRA